MTAETRCCGRNDCTHGGPPHECDCTPIPSPPPDLAVLRAMADAEPVEGRDYQLTNRETPTPEVSVPGVPSPASGAATECDGSPPRLALLFRTADSWLAMAAGQHDSAWPAEGRRALEMCGKSVHAIWTIPAADVERRLRGFAAQRPAPSQPAGLAAGREEPHADDHSIAATILDALDAAGWCESPECEAHGTCHVHKLAIENALWTAFRFPRNCPACKTGEDDRCPVCRGTGVAPGPTSLTLGGDGRPASAVTWIPATQAPAAPRTEAPNATEPPGPGRCAKSAVAVSELPSAVPLGGAGEVERPIRYGRPAPACPTCARPVWDGGHALNEGECDDEDGEACRLRASVERLTREAVDAWGAHDMVVAAYNEAEKGRETAEAEVARLTRERDAALHDVRCLKEDLHDARREVREMAQEYRRELEDRHE